MRIQKPDEITRARLARHAREQMEAAEAHSRVAPQRFLSAWKKGVARVGAQFFYCGSPMYSDPVDPVESLADVTSKWQLCPDYDYVLEHIGVLSSGERALLAAMCSFYCCEWGGDLMREIGLNGMADVSGAMDTEGTQIVAELLINYTGW